MTKAYIAWPVRIKNFDHDLHVTAKYLGTTPYDLEAIKESLKGLNTKLDFSRTTFVERMFAGNCPVLEIEGLNPEAYEVKDRLKHLRKEDYPVWRPHISIDMHAYLDVTHGNSDPIIDYSGPLTLYVDKKPVHEFS